MLAGVNVFFNNFRSLFGKGFTFRRLLPDIAVVDQHNGGRGQAKSIICLSSRGVKRRSHLEYDKIPYLRSYHCS